MLTKDKISFITKTVFLFNAGVSIYNIYLTDKRPYNKKKMKKKKKRQKKKKKRRKMTYFYLLFTHGVSKVCVLVCGMSTMRRM